MSYLVWVLAGVGALVVVVTLAAAICEILDWPRADYDRDAP